MSPAKQLSDLVDDGWLSNLRRSTFRVQNAGFRQRLLKANESVPSPELDRFIQNLRILDHLDKTAAAKLLRAEALRRVLIPEFTCVDAARQGLAANSPTACSAKNLITADACARGGAAPFRAPRAAAARGTRFAATRSRLASPSTQVHAGTSGLIPRAVVLTWLWREALWRCRWFLV